MKRYGYPAFDIISDSRHNSHHNHGREEEIGRYHSKTKHTVRVESHSQL